MNTSTKHLGTPTPSTHLTIVYSMAYTNFTPRQSGTEQLANVCEYSVTLHRTFLTTMRCWTFQCWTFRQGAASPPTMDKRKFLFASISGLIGDIAWQVLKEGHDVRYYIEAEKERDIADGFVPKSTNWEKDAEEWADIIVFDDTLGQGAKAQTLRAKGKPVIGGSEYTDKLEDDRSFGQEELKKAGVNIIPYEDFDSFDPAIEFVKKNPDRYVIKPSGEAQNVKRRLFVGEEEDGEDVIRMLEAYKKAFADEIKVFQLQRRIHGVEVAVGAFFNGGKLRRLYRFELHCKQQWNLSPGIYRALWLSHHLDSAGSHAHAHQRFFLGAGQRFGAQVAHAQRLSDWRAHRGATVSIRR